MKILFGIFDWGLGHATRDKLLILELLKKGDKVDIIATGRALTLAKEYFGKRCNYFDVPSIHIPYPENSFFVFSFVKNIPKMMKTLDNARKITKQIIKEGKYDKVISDCRYDVYDRVDNSYLINHQLRFKAFAGGQQIAELWLKARMDHFKLVIVPDFEEPNLSGELSHNMRFFDNSKIRYMGIISHLKKKNMKRDVDYFISLTGPEPQRSILEKKILSDIKNLKGKIVVAGGNPDAKVNKSLKNVRFYSYLNSKQQENMMNRCKFLITRSGYTTIMELAELDFKKALLIPTPGQTEQEYLADMYEEKRYFHHVHQDKLDLVKDLKEAEDFNGFKAPWKTKNSIKKFMEIIK